MLIDALDPELAAALKGSRPRDFAGLGIEGVRANAAERRRSAREARTPDPRVVMSDQVTESGIPVRIYRPVETRLGPGPAVLWFHGGGFILGGFEDNADLLEGFVVDTGCVAVSVEYRLAPEHPFPAAIDDAYLALQWLSAHAAELGVDPRRIAVAGGSAGGGLASCVALRARDSGQPHVALQLLMYPMLDDRATTTSSQMHTVGWTKGENDIAIEAYLGPESERDSLAYAAAARAETLVGSPRTALLVGELDLFRDDVIAFASRLYEAGVSTDLRVVAGMPHTPDSFAPGAQLTKRFIGAVRDAFAVGIASTAGGTEGDEP
jgi:acetyl esterase/lipase